jgi:thiol-disulfide isomerase/thioredoxin
MKKLIYASILAVSVIACKKSNDFVTFSGKITNKNSDSIVVSNPQLGFNRVIKVDDAGVFKDTMKVETGLYSIFDGKEYATAFLKNGSDLSLTLDTKQFDETVSFKGGGSDESNFIAKSNLAGEAFFANKNLFTQSREDFKTTLSNYVTDFNNRLNEKSFDPTFVTSQKENIESMQKFVNRMFEDKNYVATKLAKGVESPKFSNFENFEGGETSLDDLKGKYVYIDVWATWCQPCKNEIPFLQKVEKQFHDKKIEFVSISTDKQEDYFEWKEMVEEKNLGGTQLYAGDNKEFFTAYKVNSIPRFILIDPEGKIVDANAPRPSDPKLVELLNTLSL